MTFLIAFLRPYALKLAAGLFVALAIGGALLGIRNAGYRAAQAKQFQRNAEKTNAMLEAAARGPHSRRDLDRVLKDGSL